jgi:periplasmic protein TonB
MSSASLALPCPDSHRAPLDLPRIAALSTALAVNLAVLVIALRPLPPAALPLAHTVPALSIRWLEPPPPQPLPPPIELKPLPTPAAPVAPTRMPAPVAVSPPLTTEGTRAAPPATPPAIERGVPEATPAPIEARLAYRAAPLNFPAAAVRQHMHGTVLLRVLVDEQGQPLQVLVEHGSGYPLLDRSARQQVLGSWRFEPAVVHGQPVRAWAQVPVHFDLREL